MIRRRKVRALANELEQLVAKERRHAELIRANMKAIKPQFSPEWYASDYKQARAEGRAEGLNMALEAMGEL